MAVSHHRLPRRLVLTSAGAAVGAGALAACSGAHPENPETAPGTALARTVDVPVGSGVIVGDVVITQPTAGEFKGFSAVCPHAGCAVSEIEKTEIICPCHGSVFGLDGAVMKGPSMTPLVPTAIAVRGDAVVAG